MVKRVRMGGSPAHSGGSAADVFEDLRATQLFCPTCGRAMPVRERVALYLPRGALYHYTCVECGTVVGKKQEGGV